MKTLAKTMFVLFIITACSPGMLGQNTLLVYSIQPLLAYSSDIQSEIELSAELTASTYTFYMEEKVQLEDWMIEQSEWKDESAAVLASALKAEPESEILVESWMIQPFSNASQETWDFLIEATEEPLKVRRWMICCADWNLKNRQEERLEIPAITIQ
jgi:hypothetical protein